MKKHTESAHQKSTRRESSMTEREPDREWEDYSISSFVNKMLCNLEQDIYSVVHTIIFIFAILWVEQWS